MSAGSRVIYRRRVRASLRGLGPVTGTRKWPYADEEAAIVRLRLDLAAAETRKDEAEARKIKRLLEQNEEALSKLKKGRRGRL